MLRTEHVMGMPVRVDVRAAADPSVLDHVFALLRDVDARFPPGTG